MSPLADGAFGIARGRGRSIWGWTLDWQANATGGSYELEVTLYPKDWKGADADNVARIPRDGVMLLVMAKTADECWTKMQRRLQAELP